MIISLKLGLDGFKTGLEQPQMSYLKKMCTDLIDLLQIYICQIENFNMFKRHVQEISVKLTLQTTPACLK